MNESFETFCRRALAAVALIATFCLVGCDSGTSQSVDTNAPTEPGASEEPPSPPEVANKSVLEGGEYGVLTFSAQPSGSIFTETMPFFGRYDSGSYDNSGFELDKQWIFPFGGVEGTSPTSLNISGNASIDAPVRVRIRLYPNFDLLPSEGQAFIVPFLLSDDEQLCFVLQEGGALALQPLFESPLECSLANFDIQEFSQNNVAVNLDFDVGRFSTSGAYHLGFYFSAGTEADFVETFIQEDDDTYASIFLTITDNQEADLPSNVYASGNLNPSVSGFGFRNVGYPAIASLFPKELIAQEFGLNSVCFVRDNQCVGLNPYGRFVSTTLVPHDSTNGVCNGMAVAATMLATPGAYSSFKGKNSPSDYNPSAQSTIQLNYNDVSELIVSKQIAQYSKQLVAHKIDVCQSLRPTDVIDMIEAGFGTEDPIASLGIKRPGAAHAVTPYAISDEGANIKRIYVYDSNEPGDMGRYIEVDTTPGSESWQYMASINAVEAEQLYSGVELNNPMCPEPLSLYDDPDVGVLPVGSTRFINLGIEAQVIDSDGRVTGYDFESRTDVAEIPNSEATFFGYQLSSTLYELSSVDTSALSAFDAIREFLRTGYEWRTLVDSDIPHEQIDLVQSSVLRPEFTIAYELAFQPDTPLEPGHIQSFRAHQSARMITIEKPDPGQLEVRFFVTLNDQQRGYISDFVIDTSTITDNDSVGVYITDDGAAFSVFSYDSTTAGQLTQLQAGVHFNWEIDNVRPE